VRITVDKKIELLSPAGDMEKLIMSVTYGADAVYLAGNMFGMRAAAGNFDEDELRQAVKFCHDKGVAVHVTCNTVPRNNEVAMLPAYLEFLQDAGVDALIIADVGVMALAKKYAPKAELHVSTQMGVANYETARALYDMGAKRVVLARELSLDDIATLRAKTPMELEIETFVHGAMCVSFSGRCLLSNYLIDRDANRGQCAQPCRWKFHLVEERRPGEYFQISEDNGTYILNSRDMRMIEHIPELMAAGVDSLKIEGRAKSSYYAAAVTNAYRHAVDAALRGEPLDEIWVQETEHVSHREYSTGFYYDHSGPGQFYGSAMYFTDCDVAAYVEDCGDDLVGKLTQRNKFSVGDTLSLITPDGGRPVTFTAQGMKNAEGEDLETLPHPMMEFTMPLPVKAPKYSIIRKMK